MNTLLAAVPFNQTKPDDVVYTETQVLAQTWACSLGVSSCVQPAQQQFIAFRANGTK